MSMNEVRFNMVGHGPILFGRPVHEQRRDNETHAQLAARTWREKAHTNAAGELCIPAVAVHRSLLSAAKWLGLKIEGKGKQTWTHRFESGVLCPEPLLPITRSGAPVTITDCESAEIYVPSDGKRGGTTRVWRIFPRLAPPWSIAVRMLVTDESIDDEIFRRHARCAGLHDGIGSMRIGRGGPNGLWELTDLTLEPYVM